MVTHLVFPLSEMVWEVVGLGVGGGGVRCERWWGWVWEVVGLGVGGGGVRCERWWG